MAHWKTFPTCQVIKPKRPERPPSSINQSVNHFLSDKLSRCSCPKHTRTHTNAYAHRGIWSSWTMSTVVHLLSSPQEQQRQPTSHGQRKLKWPQTRLRFAPGTHKRACACHCVCVCVCECGHNWAKRGRGESSECRPTAAAIRMRIRIRRVGALIMLATGNWKWANGQWITSGQGRNGFSGWRGGGKGWSLKQPLKLTKHVLPTALSVQWSELAFWGFHTHCHAASHIIPLKWHTRWPERKERERESKRGKGA